MDLLTSPVSRTTAHKADFTNVYGQAGPEAYFRRFAQLDYRVPAYAVRLLRRVIRATRQDRHLIVDVCCSYGITAALLNHRITLADLYRRHTSSEPSHANSAAVDRGYYTARRNNLSWPIIGLDIARPALCYAQDTGLITHGIDTDLEQTRLHRGDAAILRGATLICISGGLGYVSVKTISSVIAAAAMPPTVAGFALRWIDSRPLRRWLASIGYHVCFADQRPYPQRRFTNTADRTAAFNGLQTLDKSPTLVELRGYHAAIPFVAVHPRTAAQWRQVLHAAAELPEARLL